MRKYSYWSKNSKRVNELDLNNDIKFIKWKGDNLLKHREDEELWIDYCEENKINYNFTLFREIVMVIGFGGYKYYIAYMENNNNKI